MKRKFLEDLGIEKETIDTILDEVHKESAGIKSKADDLKVEVDDLTKQIADRNKQLDDLKKLDPEGLKDEIQKLQDANTKAQEDYEAKIDNMFIENDIERELIKAGAKNIKAVKALLDHSKVRREGETVKGHIDQIQALQKAEDSKFLFSIEDKGDKFKFKGAKPGEGADGGGNKGITNPWSKESWNLTEQGRILKENPELAAQLKNG
jgi:predicted  nucleic acid-binding Zn-ribbon protein